MAASALNGHDFKEITTTTIEITQDIGELECNGSTT
jgi:hypothetical protein